jgi:hypothetical protein
MRGSIQEAIRLSSLNDDPLLCPGLISIHVKLVHPTQTLRSLPSSFDLLLCVLTFDRKLTFPTEVTIHISESFNTSRLHGNRTDLSPKFLRVLERFRSLHKPDPAIKSIEWTPSTFTHPTRSLIVEPPGFPHQSNQHADFVSEDVRQWLSSMSSPGSSLSGPASTESMYYPRKSYTEVLQSASGSAPPGLSLLEPEIRPELYKRTVHWPHSSFRYMFLGERMKTFLHETVQRMRMRHGDVVTVTCPFRDKKDASVCILLEGPQGAVDDSVNLFNRMLSQVLEDLRCITFILSGTQYTSLTAQDLVKVKAIQGSAGVHVMYVIRSSIP